MLYRNGIRHSESEVLYFYRRYIRDIFSRDSSALLLYFIARKRKSAVPQQVSDCVTFVLSCFCLF